jgi:tellurite methyltransferase
MWESHYLKAHAKDSLVWGKTAEGVLVRYGHIAAEGPVLDLGCGEGRNALHFARQGRNVEAVDSSKAALERLKLASAEGGISVDCIQADIRRYPLKSQAYSIIIMSNVLSFLPEEDACQVVQHSKSALKSGGILYIQTFSKDEPSYAQSTEKKDLGEIVSGQDYPTFWTKQQLLHLVSPLHTVYSAEILALDFGHPGNEEPHMHGLLEYLGKA